MTPRITFHPVQACLRVTQLNRILHITLYQLSSSNTRSSLNVSPLPCFLLCTITIVDSKVRVPPYSTVSIGSPRCGKSKAPLFIELQIQKKWIGRQRTIYRLLESPMILLATSFIVSLIREGTIVETSRQMVSLIQGNCLLAYIHTYSSLIHTCLYS